jgi:prepilin-type N-terminal cleavage/methylation domain-containing protein
VNSRSGKNGFTLVEILVAVAIIGAIVSMVYGSYFVTSKSAKACKRRIELSQEGQELLEKMAQQIRCSYAGSVKKSTPPAIKGALKKEETQENIINYFTGDPGEMGGEILYLVTTNRILEEKSPGLFEVTYKFDKNSGTLFLSQERFVDGSKSFIENRNWQPLAENIESIELEFSDGRDWLPTWDFKKTKALPYAVKINIICRDESFRQYCFGTTAYICSRKNQDIKTTSETLVSVNK